MRLGTTILYMARIKDGRRLESVPLVDWLVSLSGRRVFEQIWRPLLAAKLGDNYKKASASFIWSYARRFYAARQGGMKTEMFGYVPGGYARILERFTAQARGGRRRHPAGFAGRHRSPRGAAALPSPPAAAMPWTSTAWW